MKRKLLQHSVLLVLLLFFSDRATGQVSDSIPFEPGTRAYWKHVNTLQKEKFNEFREWQKQYLHVSESKFSMTWAVGYGLPVINQRVESLYPFLGTSILTVEPDGTALEKGIYTTDGRGFRFMFNGRVMFNPFAGIELGIAAELYEEIPNGSIKSPSFRSEINSRSYAITLTPQMVLTSPNLRNFYVYGRIGLHTPIWGGTRANVQVVDYRGALIREFLDADLKVLVDFGELLLDYESILGLLGYKATLDATVKVDFYKNPTVIGFQTAVGCRYQFHKKWGLVVEYFHGGYAPFLKKSSVQEFDVTVTLLGRELVTLNEEGGVISLGGNVVEISPEILSSTLNTNYHLTLNQDSNNAALNSSGFDPSQPADALTDKRLAYSHGLFIGIQYNLPGRAERGR